MADPDSRATSLAATGRATLVLTGGAVIVQLLGFVRQLFLAAEVGIDSGLDAVFIGLAAPTAIVVLLAAGVSVALVPAYIQTKEEQGIVAARRLSGTVLVWVGLAGAALSVPLWVFADEIVAITGPGLAEAGTADDAVRYLRFLAPLALLSSVSALLYATCQAERMFLPMVIASVAGPFIALAFLVHFWDSLALDGFVIGTVVGEILAVGAYIVALIMRRVMPLPRLVSHGLGLGDLARHAAPLTLSSALLQVQAIVDRAIASLLLAGGVSALRYGDSLVRLPLGAIRPAYNAAVYPTLVHAARGPAASGLGATTERLIRYGLVFFVPLAGLTIAVAPLATGILYDRGSFSDADLSLTARIVAVSAPVIVTWTVQPTLVSALNARRKGMVLLTAGLLSLVGNVVLDVVLGHLFGIVGVPMASVVVSVAVVVFMGNRVVHLEPTFSPRLIWRTFMKASLAIMPSALAFGLPIWYGVLDGDLGLRVTCLSPLASPVWDPTTPSPGVSDWRRRMRSSCSAGVRFGASWRGSWHSLMSSGVSHLRSTWGRSLVPIGDGTTALHVGWSRWPPGCFGARGLVLGQASRGCLQLRCHASDHGAGD